MTIGKRIRELRIAHALTQAELARRAGVSQVTIARIESGRYIPRLSTIRKIAEAMEIAPTEVMAGVIYPQDAA